jgi:hypothetical protein
VAYQLHRVCSAPRNFLKLNIFAQHLGPPPERIRGTKHEWARLCGFMTVDLSALEEGPEFRTWLRRLFEAW